ncbi:MAG TPA: NAD(P)H-hydrate dehydratase [Bryobacteraceae bacterium]|nr:NAD(P)H-hydrate dehydratase [Bryobacteraceae bacterium]
MKVVTGEQMREVDRLTVEDGVPSIALMENAAHRVVEEMIREFDPIDRQNIVILCGKGNNGGDGLALARLLHEYQVGRLRVVLAADPSEYKGDAADNLRRVQEIGINPVFEIPAKLRERREVNVVVDALLGTGLKGPPTGRTAELIRATREFPQAKIVAVDLPSGLGGGGDCVRADITVTFTAPKVEHYLAPGAEEHVGRLVVSQIGTPPWLIPGGLEVSAPGDFRHLFRPRKRESNKGDFGHVLIVGGAPGKTGAAAMAGLAALRAGAGLVTVGCSDSSRLAPELMSEPFDHFTLDRKTVLAVGPGLGIDRDLVSKLLKDAKIPTVIDADALNSIAGTDFRGRGVETVLTPHPGEMARLLGVDRVSERDRLDIARKFAQERNVCLVLKGYRTLIALPDGNVWINTSGSPAMATGGTGDILTGMIAGMIAQFPREIDAAVRAAVWLHGRAGQLGAEELTEQCLIATDLLHYLPKAIREIV